MLRTKNYKGQKLLKELAPSPYFSIINVHLVDINVFAKFYEIPSLLFKILKNQNVADRQTDGWTWKQYMPCKLYTPTPHLQQQTHFVGGGYKISLN